MGSSTLLSALQTIESILKPPTATDKSPSRLVWRCAVPTPLRRTFEYLPPEGGHHEIAPGTRVSVPFGRRTLIAIVTAGADGPTYDAAKLREAAAVLDTQPLLTPSLLALLTWTASYYHHPIGEVLPLGLSPSERQGKPEQPTRVEGLQLTLRGEGLPEGAPHNAHKQAALISALRGGPLRVDDLRSQGFTRPVIKALLDKALVAECDLTADASWREQQPPLTANAEQRTAIDAIAETAGTFAVHLLYGVTGSGKTEVYLQSIAACLARGEQALVLLPEIALTPQTLARFEARFDAPVAALHSGMGNAERDRVWADARCGRIAVVMGTRSAVFVPLHRPGLIVVDEEHDAAFVQQDGLRYSARDVAIKRGQLEGCNVILGSATPSLESWQNSERGRYRRHELSHRAGVGTLPKHRLIDVAGLDLAAGLSPELIQQIGATLDGGEQVLIFLNRRGFANALLCYDCGWSSECTNCDARMTLHKSPAGLHCHHCDQRARVPARCPLCQGSRLHGSGVGTQQTEAFLADHFSRYPVIRVDSDTMRHRSAMPELIDRLASGQPMLMIGTQMLSKGHHFPHVTLVAIVDADALLFSPDFRGEERLLQLLTQVSGRAGREEKPGRVIVQTRQPDHPVIRQLHAPYHTLLPDLLAHRAQAGLPPQGALGVIRCDSQSRLEGMEFLKALRGAAGPTRECQIIGPVAAAMARRKNRYRNQLVIAARSRTALASVMTALVAQAEASRHSATLNWSVDIDPYESL